MSIPNRSQADVEQRMTRWSTALRSEGGQALVALRELAVSYWYCVYVWWRRAGSRDAGAATVACFAGWLAEGRPQPEHTGSTRFREWLRARLAEIAEIDLGMPEAAAGSSIAIAPDWAEERYAQEPEGAADDVFQRRWALTVIEFAMDELRSEYAAEGKDALFAEMSPYAGFEDGDDDRYAATANRMGLTVGAARKAVFDFRSRHRELLRDFVADTVAGPEEIDGELTALLCACGAAGSSGANAPLPTAIRQFKPDELLARAINSVRMTTGSAGLWTPPTDAEVARLFPQYQMLGILGRGGMGAVYKARQIELDRMVAIKLLPLEISVDRDFADRFRREARAMAKLSHPHVIAVYDFGTTGEGHLYFVMEYVEGSNLAAMIHGPGLEPAKALSILEQICTGLAFAHEKGVVHRDIDHRADIYSLGVMFYEMLCCEVPKGVFEPPSHRTGCDPRIDQIVIKAMQQSPERRYQTTHEMRAAIEEARSLPVALTNPSTVPPNGLTQEIHPRPAAQIIVPEPKSVASREAKRSRLPLFSAVATVLVAVAGGALFFATSRSNRPGTKLVEPAVPSAAATKDQPFVNSLGMKFVPVPITGGPTDGKRVLFSIWETRVQDYRVFTEETRREWHKPKFEQDPTHPAVYVSWDDAQSFCAWLTLRERGIGRLKKTERYRLPTDYEWSCAAGIGDAEDPAQSPQQNNNRGRDVFPWGTTWPPPAKTANFSGEEARSVPEPDKELRTYLTGHRDDYPWTAPVGSFLPDSHGLYDLAGNVTEWCEDWLDEAKKCVLHAVPTGGTARAEDWKVIPDRQLNRSITAHI